jgi:hypothetical protein
MTRWLCLVVIIRLSSHKFVQLLRHASCASCMGHVSDTFNVSHMCSTSYVSCVSSMRHVMGF